MVASYDEALLQLLEKRGLSNQFIGLLFKTLSTARAESLNADGDPLLLFNLVAKTVRTTPFVQLKKEMTLFKGGKDLFQGLFHPSPGWSNLHASFSAYHLQACTPAHVTKLAEQLSNMMI